MTNNSKSIGRKKLMVANSWEMDVDISVAQIDLMHRKTTHLQQPKNIGTNALFSITAI